MRSNLTKYSINYRLNNMLLNSYIHPKEPKKCCQVREVSDNELNERKQQPTQSVGLINHTTTPQNDPAKSFSCGSGNSDNS